MDSTTIRQSDLRNDNASIMHRVGNGESFVVTVHGRAVADLVPHQDSTAVKAATLNDLARELSDVPAEPEGQSWAEDLATQSLDDEITSPWDVSG